MFRIALARWPPDNFEKMISIMQQATAEGIYFTVVIRAALQSMTKAKHTKAAKKIGLKSHKKV